MPRGFVHKNVNDRKKIGQKEKLWHDALCCLCVLCAAGQQEDLGFVSSNNATYPFSDLVALSVLSPL